MYDDVYGHFAEDLLKRIRIEAFGEDIGQNSWITSGELREFISWVEITPESLVLDVCCGAGGPAVFLAREVGCRVIGIDRNEHGVREASKLTSREARGRASFEVADAARTLPFKDEAFDVVMSIDSINHLPDRVSVLGEFRRVLKVGGRLLFTDALTVTGILGRDEIAARSVIGPMFFTPPGENERLLKMAGFEVRRVRDVTSNAALLAARRHEVREKYRDELISLEGSSTFETIQSFLGTARKLSSEGRLSRLAFLAVRRRSNGRVES